MLRGYVIESTSNRVVSFILFFILILSSSAKSQKFIHQSENGINIYHKGWIDLNKKNTKNI